MSFWYALIFFCSGALAHKVLSHAIGIYYGLEAFKNVEKYVIVYTVLNDKFIAKVVSNSLESLHHTDDPGFSSEEQRDTCHSLRVLFRKSILVTLRNNYPTWMGSTLKYKSWDDLEAYADSVVKMQKQGRKR